MPKLNALLENATVLGGITTFYFEFTGDFKDLTVVLAGIATVMTGLARLITALRGKKDERKDPPDL